MSQERPYEVRCDAFGTNPLEFASLEKQRDRLVLSSTTDLKDEVKNILEDVPNWLPLASEVLGISKDLNSYVLTPIISMPSDLPNRNQQAFSFRELTRWQHEYGMPMYKTWNGQPGHLDHKNSDPTIAKGIIFSTLMRPIRNTAGDIYKVIKLVGWDRTRDPIVANNILTRKTRSYSMGAYAKDYHCSCCGIALTKGGCEHVEHGRPTYRVYKDGKQVTAGTPGGKLAYYNVFDAKGFEISSLSTDNPAYHSASEVNHFTMDDIK